MNFHEAHAFLDSARDGLIAATTEQINYALYVTGDLGWEPRYPDVAWIPACGLPSGLPKLEVA